MAPQAIDEPPSGSSQLRVIDDFLEREQFLALQAAVRATSFAWERSAILSASAAAHLRPCDNLQDIHGFYLHKRAVRYASPTLTLIAPLLDKLAPLALLKAKVNRTARSEQHIEYGLHVDTRRRGASTAIFYLNTNNGYTLFGDGSKVASVENRIVIFDASTLHTGASCTDAPHRLVLNINLLAPSSDARQR
jgi:hypothetical protein